MTTPEEHQEGHDHITLHPEKSIIVSVAIGLLIQFIGGIWWAGSLTASLNNIETRELPSLEARVARVEGEISAGNANEVVKAEKFARVDERTTDILSSIGDIKAHVAAIEASLKDKWHH